MEAAGSEEVAKHASMHDSCWRALPAGVTGSITVRLVRSPPATISTTWDVGYDEFEDTVNLPGDTTVLLRVALADPAGNGGAAGRWMRHCHILQHGENGMMSELIVEP